MASGFRWAGSGSHCCRRRDERNAGRGAMTNPAHRALTSPISVESMRRLKDGPALDSQQESFMRPALFAVPLYVLAAIIGTWAAQPVEAQFIPPIPPCTWNITGTRSPGDNGGGRPRQTRVFICSRAISISRIVVPTDSEKGATPCFGAMRPIIKPHDRDSLGARST